MENKQLQQAKDAVAKEYGYKDWNDLYRASVVSFTVNDLVRKVATTYADSQWIDVTEIKSLPPNGKRVLCLTESGYMAVGYILNYTFERDSDCNPFYLSGYNVTHYMPLPQPPQK